MGFQNNLMKASFQPRTAEIPVPALAEFFDDEKAVWTVRGQTASEIARAAEASQRQNNISGVIEAIGQSQSKVDEIKKLVGIHDDTPADIIKRLEQITQCSVSPEIDLSCAVKLAETFPIEFYIITNIINKLTGMGMDIKKPKPSGEIAK